MTINLHEDENLLDLADSPAGAANLSCGNLCAQAIKD